jgi:prophage maintenance system killer protein
MENKGEVVIYLAEDGQTIMEVKLANESLWLSLVQIGLLFGRDKSVISRHLKNIYSEGELDRQATVAKNATVQTEGGKQVVRDIEYYNLDAILSVGYRVNSKSGTQFRIWANRVLKDYLLKDFVINEKRLQERSRQLEELKQTVKLLGNVADTNNLSSDETSGLLRVVTDYAYALDVLDQYDHQVLEIRNTTNKELFQINYVDAIKAIGGLRDKFGGSSLFGNEKDESFRGSLAAIYQTFDGNFVYPSVEEKAANLLYFVIKNHSFSDGNKRIAAFLFVWFLEKNAILYKPDGSRRIADNALVALTLMIAESKPDEKDMMVKVVVNLINFKN